VNVLAPGVATREDVIQRITDEQGTSQSLAQPGSTVIVYLGTTPKRLDMIRCPTDNGPSEAT
jgi:hypothetical protein